MLTNESERKKRCKREKLLMTRKNEPSYKNLSYKNIKKKKIEESSLNNRKRKIIDKERIYIIISLQILFGILKMRQYSETSND